MANPKKSLEAPDPAGQVIYRDNRYTSRVLILPQDRQLPVARGRVSVSGDDAEALQYLDAHPDLKPLLE
ncbi:hypothetical protein [Pseudomonas sp. C2B4]|uniref:hypothetical protein n=1 Tax=Pseudomonas sp. C2B4 TaxID=2735270 RepID=UPI001586C859|nr:hypothetical protein [Pseudomonas sp. C2B4]NUU35145.1 hypothetical protein [Pseudomonas sp. C2B4]